MKKMSLKWQLISITSLPLFFYILLSFEKIGSLYNSFYLSNIETKNISVSEAISQLIHELQIERGKTSLYLNQSTPYEDLEVQIKTSNEKRTSFLERIHLSTLSGDEKKGLHESSKKIDEIRNKVKENKNILPQETIATYSEIIKALFDSELFLAQNSSLREVKSALLSLSILEWAKENAGGLRANLSAIFGKNIPIPIDHVIKITQLKGRMDALLNSPGLAVSDETHKNLLEIHKLPAFIETNRLFQIAIASATTGNYNIDPKESFKPLTEVINSINQIIKEQINYTYFNVNHEHSRAFYYLVLYFIVLLTSVFGLVFFTQNLIKSVYKILFEITDQLSVNSKTVSNAANEITLSSAELANSSGQQASSIQMSVAAIDEINSMVQRNTASAENSKNLSSQAQENSQLGKQTIDEMISSINRLSDKINDIMKQVKESNAKISEINSVISEIGEKTKVINDIVFQTKLLSFNASVEAARAGEHGKGFAVVAEEVGKLAQMSGASAKEISDLLNSSIYTVEQIIKETTTKMASLLESIRNEVATGINTAQRCGKSLDEINNKIKEVDEVIGEMNSASQEQALGISEANKVLLEMNDLTQKNTFEAEKTAASAVNLKNQSIGLTKVVSILAKLIYGKELNDKTQGDEKLQKPTKKVEAA